MPPPVLDLIHLHAQAGGDAENQRAVRNTLPEWSLGSVHLVHVQFDKISRKTGEIYDVGFRHGSTARSADVV
jgi:hypothetical protein